MTDLYFVVNKFLCDQPLSQIGASHMPVNHVDFAATLTCTILFAELLWKAPELLSLTLEKKSKQGDIYAFGIILSEIITRTMPYENYGYPAKGWKY